MVKDPKNDFNACDDFFVLIISCHVIAAALAMLKMTSMNNTPSEDALPNAQSLWMSCSTVLALPITKLFRGWSHKLFT